jgi:hypothetical protein
MVKFVSRTEKMIALLQKNLGHVVVLHMVRDGESTIQQGILEREDEELGSFVLKIERMAREHPETREMMVLPESETEFFAEDVWYVQRQLESELQAQAEIAKQGGGGGSAIIPGSSGMAGGGFGGLQ